MPASNVLKFGLLGLGLCLGLAGCGRRGDLEPAPESGLTAKQGRAQAKEALPANPIGTPAPPKSGGIVKPKEPFILDPLL